MFIQARSCGSHGCNGLQVWKLHFSFPPHFLDSSEFLEVRLETLESNQHTLSLNCARSLQKPMWAGLTNHMQVKSTLNFYKEFFHMQFVLAIPQPSHEVGALIPILQIVLLRFKKENRLAKIMNSVIILGPQTWPLLFQLSFLCYCNSCFPLETSCQYSHKS